jgi:hypothetical protein
MQLLALLERSDQRAVNITRAVDELVDILNEQEGYTISNCQMQDNSDELGARQVWEAY